MDRLVLFQIGERSFAVDMPFVTSIRRAGALLAEQPGRVWSDRLKLDGTEMPLCDLTAVLGKAGPVTPGDAAKQKIILVQSGNDALALIVDRVDGVITVETDRITSLPGVFEGPALACFPRILGLDDDLVPLLDPDGIRRMMTEEMITT